MGMVTGGQLVARMLKKEGVRHIFTLSGPHVTPLSAGCVEEGLQVIDMRHEQAAAHAADAYARVTRGVGVAVVTTGPGVTDALRGVANAHAASSPLLLLGGAGPLSHQGRGSLQQLEQVDLFHRISKWSERVPTPEQVPAYLAKAFRVALSGRPGPVFLELAWDVLCNGVDDTGLHLPQRYRTDARPSPEPRGVDEAMALLATAERPILLAGSSVYWDGAWKSLRHFAERAQVPVFLHGAARGCLPHEHPLLFQHTREEALGGADLVFVLGAPFDSRPPEGAEPSSSAEPRIVQVDIDPTEVGRTRAVDVGLIADSYSALTAFADAAPQKRRDVFVAGLREREEQKQRELEAWVRDDGVPIHPYRLARELSAVANAPGQQPMFVADGGTWAAMASQVIDLREPGRWLDPGPLGCLGVGAPFAVASKTLHPERTHWILQGDGSFGLNGMDFETALRFELPMVCVVGNDAAWGPGRLPQARRSGEDRSPGTRLAPTRYDRVVEALGGHGEQVTEPAEIRPALERALASGTVACVNVMLDPRAPLEAGAPGWDL